MAALQDAIRKTPPGPNGDTNNPCQNYVTAVTTSASAVALVLPAAGGLPEGGCFVTWTATVDCHIRVGTQTTAATATTSDHFIAAGASFDWWHDPKLELYFSAIRAASATVDGSVHRYRSNR